MWSVIRKGQRTQFFGGEDDIQQNGRGEGWGFNMGGPTNPSVSGKF